MNNSLMNWIREEYPQKAERIIRFALPEERIIEAGIELQDHEIFVQYPAGFDEFYGSNYGRLIQIKDGIITLKAQSIDGKGYIVYTLTKKGPSSLGKLHGDTVHFPITSQRLCADLFADEWWPNLKRWMLHTHHLDHNKLNNAWYNLLLIPAQPVNLHYYMNRVQKIWFSAGEPFEEKTPYQILRQTTDLRMEDLILPLKREPDMVETQDGRPLFIYNLGECFIGFELTEAELLRREEKKRKEEEKQISNGQLD